MAARRTAGADTGIEHLSLGVPLRAPGTLAGRSRRGKPSLNQSRGSQGRRPPAGMPPTRQGDAAPIHRHGPPADAFFGGGPYGTVSDLAASFGSDRGAPTEQDPLAGASGRSVAPARGSRISDPRAGRCGPRYSDTAGRCSTPRRSRPADPGTGVTGHGGSGYSASLSATPADVRCAQGGGLLPLHRGPQPAVEPSSGGSEPRQHRRSGAFRRPLNSSVRNRTPGDSSSSLTGVAGDGAGIFENADVAAQVDDQRIDTAQPSGPADPVESATTARTHRDHQQ